MAPFADCIRPKGRELEGKGKQQTTVGVHGIHLFSKPSQRLAALMQAERHLQATP